MSKRKNSTLYDEWRSITDKMYGEKISEKSATNQLIDLLTQEGVRLRTNHKLEVKSYFVYNKEGWEKEQQKPLGLGLVYSKPDGTYTQDIFICTPNGGLDKFHREKEMIKKYPSLEGVHKDDLPI